MKRIICLVAVVVIVLYGFRRVQAQNDVMIQVSVFDVTTGQPIAPGQVLTTNTDQFQVTVTTNNIDCAGQFTVTALGAPGNPPSVLVQSVPFIIGPFGGSNSVTGGVLTAGSRPDGTNDFKVSASCNGAVPAQFAFDTFEFFVQIS